MLHHEVQNGHPGFLNFLERSLGGAGSVPSPRLGQRFISKGLYMCTINPFYHLVRISKFSMLLIIYREPSAARNISASRSNLERCPYSRGDPGMQPVGVQPAVMQRSSTGPGLSTIYGVR